MRSSCCSPLGALAASRADLLRQVLGVVLDEAEQRRAAGVLPGQAEEVEAGRLGHAAPVHDRAALVEYRHVDPGVVEPEAGRPDHRADVELGAVAERHRRAGGLEGPRVKLDAVAAQRARAGADQRVFVRLQPPADPRCRWSCGSARSCRGTRTGRGRGSAAAAASAAIRSRDGPRARPESSSAIW